MKKDSIKSTKKYYVFKMNMPILNLLSFVLLFIFVGIGLLVYKSFWKEYTDNLLMMALFLLIYFFYMVLHEIIHAIFYRINGAKGKYITFGIHLEKSILCCLCKQDISKRNICISLLSPFILIGIITFIIGAIFKIPMLFLLSIFNIGGCIGDLIMFMFIIRLPKDIKYAEFDDPTSFAILSSEDLSNKKPFGLKYECTKDSLEQKDLKKVRISKMSIAFFLTLLLLTGMMVTMAIFIGV